MQYAEANTDERSNVFAISDECRSGKNNVFAIHESFYPEVERKINRLIRKCRQYGNDFAFNVLGTEMRRDSRANRDKRYAGVFHKFIIVEVEGEARVGNWEFVATLDIRSNGNVIRRYNNDVEIPDYYKTSPNVCDHCHTERNRNNLYVVHNVETGEFKQVGKSCLMSYTGISIDYAAAIMDGIDYLEIFGGLYDFNAPREKRYYSVKDVIGYAATIIGKVGYFNVESPLTTRTMVLDMLLDNDVDKCIGELNGDLREHRFAASFDKSDFETGNSAVVDAIIDYYTSLDNGNEFTHNMQTIMREGYVGCKDLGYLYYAPQGYAKHMEREAERAKRKMEKREYWGEVGKRYKNVPVQDIRRVAAYETMYGIMNVWQIVLDNDVVLTWKSSVYSEDEVSTVTFTVKEHSEYKGIPQTVVTRCKFAA